MAIGCVSFNAWKLFSLIAFLSPQFQLVYWVLLLIALILHIGLWSIPAAEAIARQTNSTVLKVGLSNTVAFFGCIFASLTTVIEAIMGVI